MTNQRRHVILFSILFAVFAVTCATAIGAEDDDGATIPADEYTIEGISIGSTYEEIVAKLGKPVAEKKREIIAGEVEGLLVYYEGMAIVIDGDEVVKITITGAGYKMKNGIAVGSSKGEVFDKLGRAQEEMYDGRNTVRYQVITSDSQLIIRFKGGKVDEIVFFFDYL